jgi:hypothetical protein
MCFLLLTWIFCAKWDLRRVYRTEEWKPPPDTRLSRWLYPVSSFFWEFFANDTVYPAIAIQYRSVVRNRMSKAFRWLQLLKSTGYLSQLLGLLYFIGILFYPIYWCPGVAGSHLSFALYASFGGVLLASFSMITTSYFRNQLKEFEEEWTWYACATHNYQLGDSPTKPNPPKPARHERIGHWLSFRLPVLACICGIVYYHLSPAFSEVALEKEPPVATPAENRIDYQTYLATYLPTLQFQHKAWKSCVLQSTKELNAHWVHKESLSWLIEHIHLPEEYKRPFGHILISKDGRIQAFAASWKANHKPTPFHTHIRPEVQTLQTPIDASQLHNKICQNKANITNGYCPLSKTLSRCMSQAMQNTKAFLPNRHTRLVTFPLSINMDRLSRKPAPLKK